MGWSTPRTGKKGAVRYTAQYRDLRGHKHTVGTFSSRKAADRAWQAAEARLAEGRIFDPRRGRQRFKRYVEETWLPHHVMEASTREGYTYQINKHIKPWFGPMRMIDILPSHVREWITSMIADGITPATIRKVRNILSAIFTTAVNDNLTFLHPCKGVRTPTVAIHDLTIVSPEQFDLIYEALAVADMKLLVETEIETGLRWGELTELRVGDLNRTTRMLSIRRAVVQVDPKFHPEGKRFLVKDYPKDRETRRFKVSAQLAKKIDAHVKAANLASNDLLFAFQEQLGPATLRAVPEPEKLGLTEPNENGKCYKHGTPSAYNAGKCRCGYCKDALALYRAKRRDRGKDQPRRKRRKVDTDGHIPRDWFRNNVWNKALEKAGLDFHVRLRDLRHAHASWLLAGGADLQLVKDRLGHGSITTTEKYLHTLPDADETAIDAFENVRYRQTRSKPS